MGGAGNIVNDITGGISDAVSNVVGVLGGGSQVANILTGGLLTPLVGIKIPGLIELPGLLDVAPCVNWLPSVPGLGKFGNNNCDDDGADTAVGSSNSNLGPNLWHVGFYVLINEIKIGRKALVTGYYPTLKQAENSFMGGFADRIFEFCSDQPNSTLRLIFDDFNFKDNNGYINVKVEYLGDKDCPDCNNNATDFDSNVAINYATIDTVAMYPVDAHGMRYVGSESHGLSTGGRTESLSIAETEQNLLNKYSSNYTIDVTQNSTDLVQTRVLDLTYRFDGSTWIRQQNLLESVYWHAGVGDENHSIFWGGLHDSLAPFKFSYVDNTSASPSASYTDWNCKDSRIIQTLAESKKGPEWSTLGTIVTGGCWNPPPIWENIAHSLVFANPKATDNIFNPTHDFKEARLEYSKDPDFPKFIVFDFSEGIHRFVTTDQVYSGIDFEYPELNALSISASMVSGGYFSVMSEALGTTTLFDGTLNMEGVGMDFQYLDRVYPLNMSAGSIENEQKSFAFRSWQNTVAGPRLEYGYLYTFNYMDNDTAEHKRYGINGKGFVQFDTLDNIFRTAIISGQPVQSNQNVMLYVSTETPTSADLSGAKYAYGTASIQLSMDNWNGVMVEVDSLKEKWTSSLEDCGSDITSYLNITAENKTANAERWGTPLWSAVFNTGATFDLDYDFSFRDEKTDGNILIQDYESATLAISSDSIASIVNRRILIKGYSEEQDHIAIAINNVGPLGRWGVDSVSFSADNASPCGETMTVINISGFCAPGDADAFLKAGGINIVVSNTCTPTSATWPSHFSLNSYTPLITSVSAASETTVIYDVISPTIHKIKNWHFQANPASLSCERKVNVSFDPNICAYGDIDTALGTLLSVGMSAACCSEQGSFPINFQLIGITGEKFNGNDSITNESQYHYYDTCVWTVQSTTLIPSVTGCLTNSLVVNTTYISGATAYAAANTNVSGTVPNSCLAVTYTFPTDFAFVSQNIISPTLTQVVYSFGPSGSEFLVVNCASVATGKLFVTTEECKSGQVFVKMTDCLSDCDLSQEVKLIDLSSIPISGTSYTEWATSFVQEWQADKRYKIPAQWVESNGYSIKPENTGVNWKNSSWKRHMDGVGLGGDAPDYDTIWDYQKNVEKMVTQWRQIAGWHIGQMAFGTPLRAVVVGGHKVDRNVGRTLIGSGTHASPTTKRIFVWDLQAIPEEDTYLMNYLGRRFFSTIEDPANIIPISGAGNKTDLNVIIFDAQSNIVVERTGIVKINGSTGDATFDTPMPDEAAEYSIVLTPNDNIQTWWTEKTASGFTINVELENWVGEVTYLATAVIKVTETDITGLGQYDGYEWNK